ncbi:hypothetical protein CVD28_13780 [Bacillus sp. M6-12]|uniref:GerAB/ArcD/ProY family transporter n=1 Tax=Bacillus sp. M6-12 TaxID=2054166 RepID=UPI000C78E1F5|nr:GerAB/ArcD/ProY family transporter [Bacillus sp. M6-12]PLS17119.1 hypothetical protein CVD28_13780 [Bacillus sp. M6-12]
MKGNIKGKIGIREYVAILVMMIGAKLSDDTPALLFDELESSAWMIPLLSGLMSFLPVFLLIRLLLHYENKNLHEINLSLFGRYFGFFISFCLWLIGSFALVVDSRSYVDIIKTMYFPATPSVIIYLAMMAVVAYGAKKGIEAIGSVAYSLVYYVKGFLLLAFILVMRDVDFSKIFPIFGSGPVNIIQESTHNLAIYADILYMGLIFPYLAKGRDMKKGTWFALIYLMVELSFSFLIYLTLFDYLPVKMMNYPFHELIRYISFGEFLTNIETLFVPIWLIATFVRFSAYLYLNALLFGDLFKIKNFEYIVPSLALIFVGFGMLMETPTFTIFSLRKNLYLYLSPLFFFLPILLWLTASFKGEFKNGKKKHA